MTRLPNRWVGTLCQPMAEPPGDQIGQAFRSATRLLGESSPANAFAREAYALATACCGYSQALYPGVTTEEEEGFQFVPAEGARRFRWLDYDCKGERQLRSQAHRRAIFQETAASVGQQLAAGLDLSSFLAIAVKLVQQTKKSRNF